MTNPLEKARLAQQELRQTGELEKLNPVQRSIRTPTSLTNAIKATCYECVGAGSDANPRKEVAQCTAWACPLWSLRPWQHMVADDYGQAQRQAALADYSSKTELAVVNQPKSRRKAVNAKCAECTGNNRQFIDNCNNVFPLDRKLNQPGSYFGCPLWPHRPLSKKARQANANDDTSLTPAEDPVNG
ncbi:MAG TPA: hypothetical protein VIQ81_04065 [Gammaproteobacteria bacterium]